MRDEGEWAEFLGMISRSEDVFLQMAALPWPGKVVEQVDGADGRPSGHVRERMESPEISKRRS